MGLVQKGVEEEEDEVNKLGPTQIVMLPHLLQPLNLFKDTSYRIASSPGM